MLYQNAKWNNFKELLFESYLIRNALSIDFPAISCSIKYQNKTIQFAVLQVTALLSAALISRNPLHYGWYRDTKFSMLSEKGIIYLPDSDTITSKCKTNCIGRCQCIGHHRCWVYWVLYLQRTMWWLKNLYFCWKKSLKSYFHIEFSASKIRLFETFVRGYFSMDPFFSSHFRSIFTTIYFQKKLFISGFWIHWYKGIHI